MFFMVDLISDINQSTEELVSDMTLHCWLFEDFFFLLILLMPVDSGFAVLMQLDKFSLFFCVLQVFCYSLSADDSTSFRGKIAQEAEHFTDLSKVNTSSPQKEQTIRKEYLWDDVSKVTGSKTRLRGVGYRVGK